MAVTLLSASIGVRVASQMLSSAAGTPFRGGARWEIARRPEWRTRIGRLGEPIGKYIRLALQPGTRAVAFAERSIHCVAGQACGGSLR
jgi:hypothetical protein